MGASAGLVPVLKALGANDTLPLLVTVTTTPRKWCATARQATQVRGWVQTWGEGRVAGPSTHTFLDYEQGCGVRPVPLGTLGIHQGQVANASHVSAVETLTPRTLRPVTLTRGSAYAAYTIQRGHTVPTASLASTGRRPERAVTVSVDRDGAG